MRIRDLTETDWGSMSKREFKRAELDHELGHEEQYQNYEVSINGKPWKVFRSRQSAQKAASTIQNKYGKETKVYATMKPVSEEATAGATSAGNIATVANPHQAYSKKKPKKQRPTDNALDNKNTGLFGQPLKR